MKIVHTADWHLGKIVNSVHMTEEQAYILDQLVDIIRTENPDVLVIAGDLYDRAIPPKEAVDLLNRVLTTLVTDIKIPVLAISGNHDSPERLEFGTELFRSQGLYIETRLSRSLEPVVIEDEHGPVYFHLVPYIEPAEARELFNDDTIHSHQTAMEAVTNYIREHHDMKERHLFVGHAFVAGGMESESEERLSMIGGTPYVDANLFQDFVYVALGHLHQPQRIKRDEVRYSGSILKYSFSEATHKKSVTIIELDADGTCELKAIPLVPKHDMRIVEGYFEDLLTNPLENNEDYLHIRLLDKGQIMDPMYKLRKVYPNILRLERIGFSTTKSLLDLQQIRQKQTQSHTELFASFYEEITGEAIDEKRMAYIESTISTVMAKERGE
ncbi:exonuclease SbcCD subunit D [Ornithinibacillus massiliensis]|uniref:Nuclease SbcCD subunit D n=1 Tax=Ornithinibacillus massiliensis TaxID=1944633 RepID=A0ABS5MBT7_9BACI|nr:exonuclease SbcCD subunit D [Ornithinibacillus massiliensis]MBS3679774.1 exonuclease SbcCD subunit D [Ornithinibacillus massiliensis]